MNNYDIVLLKLKYSFEYSKELSYIEYIHDKIKTICMFPEFLEIGKIYKVLSINKKKLLKASLLSINNEEFGFYFHSPILEYKIYKFWDLLIFDYDVHDHELLNYVNKT